MNDVPHCGSLDGWIPAYAGMTWVAMIASPHASAERTEQELLAHDLAGDQWAAVLELQEQFSARGDDRD